MPRRSTVKAPFAGCVKLVKALFTELAKPFNAATLKEILNIAGVINKRAVQRGRIDAENTTRPDRDAQITAGWKL